METLRPAGMHVENFALEQVRAGVDFVGRLFAFWRLLDERSYAAVCVVHDATEGRRIVDVDEMQRADPALLFVVRAHRVQVEAGEHVAVEDEKRAA